MKRKTILRKTEITGIGLHKGENITLLLKPNENNEKIGKGIVFKRVDILDKDNIVKLDYKNLFALERGTNIRNSSGVEIYTVEHFLSALSVSGITDILVEISGNELPIMDGSSILFIRKLEEAGIKELDEEIETIEIKEPVIFKDEKNGKYVIAFPYEKGLKISYTIDFNHNFLKTQYFETDITFEKYVKEIASSRTFVFDYEIDFLRKNNLALGGSLENAVVIASEGVLNPEGLRFENEFVRHKILDIIGDLYVLGKPLKAHIVAVKAGHYVNAEMTKLIAEKYLK